MIEPPVRFALFVTERFPESVRAPVAATVSVLLIVAAARSTAPVAVSDASFALVIVMPPLNELETLLRVMSFVAVAGVPVSSVVVPVTEMAPVPEIAPPAALLASASTSSAPPIDVVPLNATAPPASTVRFPCVVTAPNEMSPASSKLAVPTSVTDTDPPKSFTTLSSVIVPLAPASSMVVPLTVRASDVAVIVSAAIARLVNVRALF